jgi:hypothetical protein
VRSIDYVFEDRGFLASLSENDGNPSNLFYNYDYAYDQWGRNTSATIERYNTSRRGGSTVHTVDDNSQTTW